MWSRKILLLVFLLVCIFFTAGHFHFAGRSLLASSIFHILTAAMKFFIFFFQRNSFSLFLISCSSSVSVTHVSVHLKL